MSNSRHESANASPGRASASRSTSSLHAVWPSNHLTLPGGRMVRLAPLEYHHTDQLWPVVSADDVVTAGFWKYLGARPWKRREDLATVVRSRIQCRDGVFWALLDLRHEAAPACGWIGMRHIDVREGKGELGIFLPSPLSQRTGLATEAVFLLLRYCFEDLGFSQICWSTDSRNEASRRAAERIGFGFGGSAVDGLSGVEMLSYVLLQSDWSRVKEALEIWLGPENFDEDGRQRRRLDDIRKTL